MLFNSFSFLLFFTLLCGVYFALPHKARLGLLLAASYYFYMCWRVEYILLILISTSVDYVSGLGIDRAPTQRRKRIWLGFSLFTNLGLLFTFKYYSFFSDSLRAVFQQFNIMVDLPGFHLLLPVGISFYTFQTLAYTLDIYFGRRKAERHLGLVALYVAFFPQLVAGPIERSGNLMPQFQRPVAFEYARVVSGMRLMLWGYFKKMMIADRLALYVNPVYADVGAATPTELLLATVFFAFQIYCDFSAYSDIAIGSARILGIDLMRNFRRPYLSRSVSEFWRRWHISLGTWFRDYLYIPLGGSRDSRIRAALNLVVVFLVSGLWHGANWTFVIWGGLHAIYMLVERGFSQRGLSLLPDDRLGAGLRILSTFMLVTLAWVYFRAESVGDAWLVVQTLFFGIGGIVTGVSEILHNRAIVMGLALILALMAIEIADERWQMVDRLARAPLLLRWAVYYAGVFMILLFGVLVGDEFIYFQF